MDAKRLEDWFPDHRKRNRLLVVTDNGEAPDAIREHLSAGLHDAQTLFQTLPRPRWVGPVVVIIGSVEHPALPTGSNMAARSARFPQFAFRHWLTKD